MGIAAATAAIWLPCRRLRTPANPATWEFRQRYQRHGIAWSAKRFAEASSVADRKAVERLIGGMGLDKSVKVHGAAGRTTSVRLTSRGLADAQAMAAIPDEASAADLMRDVLNLATRGFEAREGTWIPEREFDPAVLGRTASTKPPCDDLKQIEDELLPALIAGWIISNADHGGNVSYSLTELGHQVAFGTVKPTVRSKLDATEEDQDFYFGRLRIECDLLRLSQPESTRELGYIALPAAPMGGRV